MRRASTPPTPPPPRLGSKAGGTGKWGFVVAAAAVLGCWARSSLDLSLADLEGTGGGAGAGGAAGAGGNGGGGPGGGAGRGSNGRGGESATSGGMESAGSTGGGGSLGGGSPYGGSSGCGDTGPAPPSCAPGGPGMTNCGACSESCCRSIDVTGGLFDRTYTYAVDGGQAPQDEADPATVSELRVDKYLVTVGRFRQFRAAWAGGVGYAPPAGSGKHAYLNSGQGLAMAGDPGSYEHGWSAGDNGWLDPTDASFASCAHATWTPAPAANENLPINCVDWWEAYAFCIWDDAFLPSEAELGYASAGGDEQREFPWGTAAPGTRSEYAIFGFNNSDGCYYPSPGPCTGVANIAAVGMARAGAGRWGQLDLAGDVGEWALDLFAPYVDPCTDCAQLTSGSLRVIRGGAYDYGVSYLVPSFRDGRYPPGRNGDVGFRCARTP